MNAQQITVKMSAFALALNERNVRIASKDNDIALSFLKSHDKAIKAGLIKLPANVFDKIIEAQSVDLKASNEFIAVKVNVKILKMLAAFGQGLANTADSYSKSIIKNLINLQGIDNLNAYRSICSKIEIDELQIASAIKIYHDCSIGTAKTQVSSTREMLRALDLCEVKKRAKGDVITLKEGKHVEYMVSLFA